MKSEILTELLKIITFVGVSIFIAWSMTGIMKRETMCTSLPVNLSVTAVYSALLYMRFGISLTAVQGMLLLFVLLWASWSDITSHEVGDYIWIMIFMLGLLSIETVGIRSMLIGAAALTRPKSVRTTAGEHASWRFLSSMLNIPNRLIRKRKSGSSSDGRYLLYEH
jgi:hypothetical protein